MSNILVQERCEDQPLANIDGPHVLAMYRTSKSLLFSCTSHFCFAFEFGSLISMKPCSCVQKVELGFSLVQDLETVFQMASQVSFERCLPQIQQNPARKHRHRILSSLQLSNSKHLICIQKTLEIDGKCGNRCVSKLIFYGNLLVLPSCVGFVKSSTWSPDCQ